MRERDTHHERPLMPLAMRRVAEVEGENCRYLQRAKGWR
jgi:hypothetical protein